MVTRRLVLGHGVLATFMLPELAPGHAHASPARLNTVLAPPQGHIAPLSKAPPPLVFLDPGHGGKDPGAIGITGTYEKDIALAAAQELMRQLLADRRYRVELSRGQDVFIPLEERVAIAQRKGAAIFVSMHADAINDPGIRGASVYTLAGTASDAQTAALAQRENSADRFAGSGYGSTSPEVAKILSSLVLQETRAGSARMARGLVGSLDRDVRLLQNPARHAGFVVLKAADIPSVLVEMGFMSNHEDEAELRRPEHRARVAGAMKRAVDAYFAETAGQHMAG
jgi:N-acetylmuramoyl-L-alanine amidase